MDRVGSIIAIGDVEDRWIGRWEIGRWEIGRWDWISERGFWWFSVWGNVKGWFGGDCTVRLWTLMGDWWISQGR